MPLPPDMPLQMGRGGAAGPNKANPVIPKIIRTSRGNVKSRTSSTVHGRLRTGSITAPHEDGDVYLQAFASFVPLGSGTFDTNALANLEHPDGGAFFAAHPGWLSVTSAGAVAREYVDAGGRNTVSAFAGALEADECVGTATWTPDDPGSVDVWPTLTLFWRLWALT